jgi:hypothetical protein
MGGLSDCKFISDGVDGAAQARPMPAKAKGSKEVAMGRLWEMWVGRDKQHQGSFSAQHASEQQRLAVQTPQLPPGKMGETSCARLSDSP